MTDEQILEVIQIGINDSLNEEETFPLPYWDEFPGITQMSYEHGLMMEREGFTWEEMCEEEKEETFEDIRINGTVNDKYL